MYKLVYYPDPLLKTISEPILDFNLEALKTIGTDMIEAIIDNNGIGLAAIQIGQPIRMMILKTREADTIIYMAMCNPEVVQCNTRRVTGQEGCLSFPGIRVDIDRPEDIILKWHNLIGAEYTTAFKGIEARCIQHEIDHMNGITFIDKLPDFRRIMIQQKLTTMKIAYNKVVL